jgi:hypothetical protein
MQTRRAHTFCKVKWKRPSRKRDRCDTFWFHEIRKQIYWCVRHNIVNKYLSIQTRCRLLNVGSAFISDLRRSQKSQFLHTVSHFTRYVIDSNVAGISEMNCTAHVDTIKFLHVNFIYRSIKVWFFVLYKMSCLSSLSLDSSFTHIPLCFFSQLYIFMA